MERKTPINRVNKFFSFEDFNIDIEMGREGTEGDNNTSVVLYRVDRTQTQSDDIYGETSKDGIRYLPPVELLVASFRIDATENKTYNTNGSLRYAQRGKLNFNIYIKTLKEMDVDISFGDYIGYAADETTMLYYEVVNDGLMDFDNLHTMIGYKRYFRSIVCAAVNADVFSGK